MGKGGERRGKEEKGKREEEEEEEEEGEKVKETLLLTQRVTANKS